MKRQQPHALSRLATLAPLEDPVRRSLYEYVARSDVPVDRDAAASAVGVTRALAAFHLEKLVAAGMLSTEQPTAARRGPGRPRKRYRRAIDLAIQIPPRNYPLLTRILAAAVGVRWSALKRSVAAIARHQGKVAALAAFGQARPRRHADTIVRELARLGYEPRLESDRIVLHNCPFAPLSRDLREQVCAANRAFLEGFAVGAGARAISRDPDGDGCCGHIALS